MWVYDGEQWVEEGVSDTEAKPEQKRPPLEDLHRPELQVIEIVPVPTPNYVPPFPLP